MTICAAMTKAGARCRAPSMRGSSVCWFHDPSRASERRDASSRGGLGQQQRLDPSKSFKRPILFNDPIRVAAVLEKALVSHLAGSLSSKSLVAVASSARAILQALDDAQTRKELDELRSTVERIEAERRLVHVSP